jgi:hypothetical protein
MIDATPQPAPDDLVERVARAMCDVEWGDGIWDKPGLLSEETERKLYRELARTAIAIALEEAARVAVLTINSRPELTSYDVWLAICDLIPTGTIPAQDDTSNAE